MKYSFPLEKKVVLIDIDDVLADFAGAIKDKTTLQKDPVEMYEPGFFRNLSVLPGAQAAVSELLRNPMLDVYIASKPLYKRPGSATEKFEWINEHFPALKNKIFLTPNKHLLLGHILIDDTAYWGEGFKGNFVHFKDWTSAMKQINSILKLLV